MKFSHGGIKDEYYQNIEYDYDEYDESEYEGLDSDDSSGESAPAEKRYYSSPEDQRKYTQIRLHGVQTYSMQEYIDT